MMDLRMLGLSWAGTAILLLSALNVGCREHQLQARQESVLPRELEPGPAPLRPAANVPSGFTEDVLATGLVNLTALAIAPDGRLFVAQQAGALRVVKNGALLATPFLSLSVNSEGERGLLGVALDPNFGTNGFVYAYFTTAAAPIHNRLSRFTANGDVALAGSELVLLDLETLVQSNHNGGGIHFGPDGKLYVGVGENAVTSNAQTLANRLGKLLRINSDGSIPSDNPFFLTASGVNRSIWALGLRNPYNFAFQPGTGRLFVNDVGDANWEEINDGVAGSNYGWPTTEGPTTNPAFRAPLFAYPHSGGPVNGCAIVGGTFYNPAQVAFPSAYVGRYFFGDFCSDWIKTYDPVTGSVADFATAAAIAVDMAVHSDGALYYLSRGTSSVRRIRFTGPPVSAVPAGNFATGLLAALGFVVVGIRTISRARRGAPRRAQKSDAAAAL